MSESEKKVKIIGDVVESDKVVEGSELNTTETNNEKDEKDNKTDPE